LGLQTDDRNGGVRISGLIPNTQSGEHPKLEVGMQISSVSGEDCSGLGYSQVIAMIRGHPSRPLAIAFLPVGAESRPTTVHRPEPRQQPEPEPEPEAEPDL
jgi:C-terminal processing protease CtpA/Prc